jgi:hypothetical protein
MYNDFLKVGAALMHDAVNLLHRAIDLLRKRRHVNFNRKVSCEAGNNSLPWLNGNSLIYALKMVGYAKLYDIDITILKKIQ